MTIYMTTESLATSGARPTVYAAVFTCDNDNGTLGPWRMIGDIYKGDALVVGYTGNTTSSNSGSFSTDDWYAYAGTYTLVAGSRTYQYYVAEDATIESIIQVKADVELKSVLDSLIEEANAASELSEIAGPVLIDLRIAIAEAQTFVESYVQGTTLRAEVIPVIKKLNSAYQSYLDAIASLE